MDISGNRKIINKQFDNIVCNECESSKKSTNRSKGIKNSSEDILIIETESKHCQIRQYDNFEIEFNKLKLNGIDDSYKKTEICFNIPKTKFDQAETVKLHIKENQCSKNENIIENIQTGEFRSSTNNICDKIDLSKIDKKEFLQDQIHKIIEYQTKIASNNAKISSLTYNLNNDIAFKHEFTNSKNEYFSSDESKNLSKKNCDLKQSNLSYCSKEDLDETGYIKKNNTNNNSNNQNNIRMNDIAIILHEQNDLFTENYQCNKERIYDTSLHETLLSTISQTELTNEVFEDTLQQKNFLGIQNKVIDLSKQFDSKRQNFYRNNNQKQNQIKNIPQISPQQYHARKKLTLYKTEICRSFEENNFCRYGPKCQFAHSTSELRKIDRHPRYKTEICKTYWEDGTCPYGRRCCFIHRREELNSNNDEKFECTVSKTEILEDSQNERKGIEDSNFPAIVEDKNAAEIELNQIEMCQNENEKIEVHNEENEYEMKISFQTKDDIFDSSLFKVNITPKEHGIGKIVGAFYDPTYDPELAKFVNKWLELDKM